MFETVLMGFIGGVCGWFFTDFLTKPLRRFFDLRREVNRCLVRYGNVSARAKSIDDYRQEELPISPQDDARLTEAHNALRDLAAEMRAFANCEKVADRIVAYLGYDADAIASALIGYSNSIFVYGKQRSDSHDRVEKLLGIRTHAAPHNARRSPFSL